MLSRVPEWLCVCVCVPGGGMWPLPPPPPWVCVDGPLSLGVRVCPQVFTDLFPRVCASPRVGASVRPSPGCVGVRPRLSTYVSQ